MTALVDPNVGHTNTAIDDTDRFTLRPPPLPDPETIGQFVSAMNTHKISGQVGAISGESIEIEGMTAPIGAVCEIHSIGGIRKRCQVIGFRGVRPIVAPLERL